MSTTADVVRIGIGMHRRYPTDQQKVKLDLSNGKGILDFINLILLTLIPLVWPSNVVRFEIIWKAFSKK